MRLSPQAAHWQGCSPNGGSTGGSGEAEQVVGTAPVSFSEETDVLILGTGIAGMSAAMDPVEARP